MRAVVSPVVLLCASALLAPAETFAQQPPPGRLFGVQREDPAAPAVAVHLAYAAPDGCPTEKDVRDIVSAKMGYDPFTPPATPAPFSVSIVITRQGPGFAGAVELRDTAGGVLWSRPPLADGDCRRVVGAIGGVSVPVAIDNAVQAAAAAALPLPPPPPPAPPPPPTTSPARPAVRLGVRAAAAVGVGPAPTAAISGDLGVGWQFFSLNGEFRADVPTTGGVAMGVSARTSVIAGSFLPCGHYRWLAACGLISVGVLRAEGVNVMKPAQDSGLYAAAGVRVGIEWPVVPTFALRLSGDALVNLHPLAAQVDFDAGRAEVWRSGPFAAMLGGGAVVRFGP